MIDENQIVTIYGLKMDGKFCYIGRVLKELKTVNINSIPRTLRYKHPFRDVVFGSNSEHEFVVLNHVPRKESMDVLYNEIVSKNDKNNPIVNYKPTINRKHGYWKNRMRDKYTLRRLSESKFKKVAQYDKNGKLVKIWKSVKDAAIDVFKDYVIVPKSGSDTILYELLNNKNINFKFARGSYWFYCEYLETKYEKIPKSINIEEIKNEEHTIASNRSKNAKREIYKTKTVYSVIEYDSAGVVVNNYCNVDIAAEKLGLTDKRVSQVCRYGGSLKNGHVLSYGEKNKKQINNK